MLNRSPCIVLIIFCAILTIIAGCTQPHQNAGRENLSIQTQTSSTAEIPQSFEVPAAPITYVNSGNIAVEPNQEHGWFSINYPSTWKYTNHVYDNVSSEGSNFVFYDANNKSQIVIFVIDGIDSEEHFYSLHTWADNSINSDASSCNITMNTTTVIGGENAVEYGFTHCTYYPWPEECGNDGCTLNKTTTYNVSVIRYMFLAGPMQGYNLTMSKKINYQVLTEKTNSSSYDFGIGGQAWTITEMTVNPSDETNEVFNHIINSLKITVPGEA